MLGYRRLVPQSYLQNQFYSAFIRCDFEVYEPTFHGIVLVQGGIMSGNLRFTGLSSLKLNI